METHVAQQVNQTDHENHHRDVPQVERHDRPVHEDGRCPGPQSLQPTTKRFFQDEHALSFTVDAMGAPGKQWSEMRLGTIRPRLNWQIEEQSG